MRQISTRDQMTRKLTTKCHRTTLINEQNQYHIVSYKRPRYDSLSHPNVMKLIHNAYYICTLYHKTNIKFEYCWLHFYLSRVMPFLKWKLLNFSFPFITLSLPRPNVMKLISNAKYCKTLLIYVESLLSF